MAIIIPDTPNSPGTSPAIPTAEQIEKALSTLVAITLGNYRQMGVDGFAINAIGNIFAKLTYDGVQTPADVKAMIHTEAQAVFERLKVELLRASIVTPTPSTLN